MARPEPVRLQLTRNDLISTERAQRIHEQVLRVLERVGLAVLDEGVRQRMAAAGLRVRGERVYLDAPRVEDYLAGFRGRMAGKERTKSAAASGSSAAAPPPTEERRIAMRINQYAHHVHDLDRDEIVPYTTDKLIEMTKFVDTFAGRDVFSAAPGYPMDVPGMLQPVIQYRVGAEYSRNGVTPTDAMTIFASHFVYEMAEVMGQPIRELPLYVYSPLRLGGESLDLVMHWLDRLDRIEISSMPAAGATAPLEPFGAHVLAAAENLGAAVAMSAICNKEVNFWVGLHPFDLRSGSMVMGSPEHQLYALAAADLTAFYSGSRKFGVSSAYTRANWPGYQAAAEKASAMTTGALLGSRFFMTPGTLALDEVFSPEQFLIDVEVRDHVQRLVDGFIYREDDYDWVEQIGAGAEGTFLAQDSTLDVYREAYWQPRLFDRGFLHGHEQGERARQLQRIRAMVRDSLASYDFELDADRRREMHRIWQAAVESYATTDEHR